MVVMGLSWEGVSRRGVQDRDLKSQLQGRTPDSLEATSAGIRASMIKGASDVAAAGVSHVEAPEQSRDPEPRPGLGVPSIWNCR
ncbi:hypothetical protein GGTG_09364 [Gaeumannomyces tritici R3-111a-1]|uniref:Uncharacterized protein n=1 Tax=Gaeumannomyces tritici (strain R3-111a-1) TaxID=644352 RepID=J3P767_GAET3|nr:hypothetical protein GGTG_09364 [Gaeumannomyces tritici R3-111a-1]EJT72498.1 hypothetical protein GGTG_09364 [Gaeumannomyces tritici R3-111a-1]